MTQEEIQLEQDKIKLEILKHDLEEKRNPALKQKLKIDPVFATILVALIGFLSTTVISVYNSIKEKNLKQREFEFELIKKGLEQPNEEQRIELLRFINTLKLIKDREVSIALDSALLNPESIPSIGFNEMLIKNDPIIVDTEFKKISNVYNNLPLKAAQKYIGTAEDFNGDNSGKNISKFIRGGKHIPWSCAFVCWCFSQNSEGKAPFKFTYSWSELIQELKEKQMYSISVSAAKVGDIYFLSRGGQGNMVIRGGIIEKINKDSVIGIEGNINNRVDRRTIAIAQIVGVGKIR